MPLPLPHIFQIVRALASSIGQAEAGDVDGEAEAALLQIMKLAPVDGKCDALPEADVLRILGLFEAERPSVRTWLPLSHGPILSCCPLHHLLWRPRCRPWRLLQRHPLRRPPGRPRWPP